MSVDTASIANLIEQFPQLIAAHQVEAPQPCSLKDQLAAVYGLPYLRFGTDPESAERRRAEIARAAVQAQIAHRIAQIFPLLDGRLLELSRWLVVEWRSAALDAPPVIVSESRVQPEGLPLELNGRSKHLWQQAVKIPLVLQRSSKLASQPTLDHPKAGRQWRGKYALKCDFPGSLPTDLLLQANEAKAVFYDVLAELYRTPGYSVGEQIRIVPPAVDALWIPQIEDIGFEVLMPQTRDPALVVQYNKQMLSLAPGSWSRNSP